MKGDGDIWHLLKFLCDDGRNAVAQIEIDYGLMGLTDTSLGTNRIESGFFNR